VLFPYSQTPNQAESLLPVIQPDLVFPVRISCSCFFNKDAGEFENIKPVGKKPAFAQQGIKHMSPYSAALPDGCVPACWLGTKRTAKWLQKKVKKPMLSA